MPSRAVDQLAREAARRQVVTVLKVTEALAAYSARSIGNGLSPEQARQATIETAIELERTAATLRRLTRPSRIDPAERRLLAAELAASGLSQRQIATALGVTKKTIWDDLRRAGWVYPGSPRY